MDFNYTQSAPVTSYSESYRKVDWKALINNASKTLDFIVYYHDKWIAAHYEELCNFLKKPNTRIRFFFTDITITHNAHDIQRIMNLATLEQLEQKIHNTYAPLVTFCKTNNIDATKIEVYNAPELLMYPLKIVDGTVAVISFFEMYRAQQQVDAPAIIFDLPIAQHINAFVAKELAGLLAQSKRLN